MTGFVTHREPKMLTEGDLQDIEARVHDLADGEDARYVTGSQVRDLVYNLRVTQDKIAEAVHQLELAQKWEPDGSSARCRIEQALELLNST